MGTCNYSLIDKYPETHTLGRAFFEFSCPEQSYGDSEYCILHHDFPKDGAPDFEVIKRHKEQKVNEKKDSRNFNFIGARIYEIDGAGRQDIGNVDLTDAEIRGNVNFKGAYIGDGVRITDATIEGDVSFDGATISGFVAIYRVKEGPAIKGDFSFTGTTLPASWFDGLEIRKDVSFDRATIVGNAYFRDIIVKGSVWFNDVTVNGAVLFKSAKVDGNIWIEGTDRISGELSFQGATFKRPRAEESACRAAKQNCERRGGQTRS
jgi:cytoskeletal protein CcmA (bactofilin family)